VPANLPSARNLGRWRTGASSFRHSRRVCTPSGEDGVEGLVEIVGFGVTQTVLSRRPRAIATYRLRHLVAREASSRLAVTVSDWVHRSRLRARSPLWW